MPKIEPVAGWGIVYEGKILLSTVANTDRATKVNGIIVLGKTMVMDEWPDRYIDYVWDQVQSSTGAYLVQVTCDIASGGGGLQ